MNLGVVEKIANAVLYEGYVLYPYRASAMKNRQRFNFGVLYPPDYWEAQAGNEACRQTTQCLVLGNAETTVDVKARFLQLAERNDWQEGIERDVSITGHPVIAELSQQSFAFPAVHDDRRQESLAGALEVATSKIADGLYRLTITVRNDSPLAPEQEVTRDEALLRAMVSVHSILHVTGGEFVSLLDPPNQFRDAVAACKNVGAWPVLVGEESQRDIMLSAPIILYDYPQIAPESPGDLCDGLEIDEILALRIMTMTDAEKQEVRDGDDRARQILERTELMPPEQFQKLHGALRGLRR